MTHFEFEDWDKDFSAKWVIWSWISLITKFWNFVWFHLKSKWIPETEGDSFSCKFPWIQRVPAYHLFAGNCLNFPINYTVLVMPRDTPIHLIKWKYLKENILHFRHENWLFYSQIAIWSSILLYCIPSSTGEIAIFAWIFICQNEFTSCLQYSKCQNSHPNKSERLMKLVLIAQ